MRVSGWWDNQRVSAVYREGAVSASAVCGVLVRIFSVEGQHTQYSIAFQTSKLCCRSWVLLLRLLQQLHELGLFPKGSEPRIARHGRVTVVPSSDHAFKQLQ